MNKVVVELAESKPKALLVEASSGSNNPEKRTAFEGWVTADYTAAQLCQDLAHFWQLDATKYELLGGVGIAVVADETLLDSLVATEFTLRKRQVVRPDSSAIEQAATCERHDPFWLQEKLFDVFLIHSLPHWNGKGSITMSCYQFKQLVLKAIALSKSTETTKKFQNDLTVRVVLAFKTATPNFSGAGAKFNEFLDALIDVAAFAFPRLSSESKELALEQLTAKYLIPYYDKLERSTVHRIFPSWLATDELVLMRPKVKHLLQRFAQPLFEIALAYTTSVAGPRTQRGLQFQEFSRFVHDIKPTMVPLNTLELCFCFIHCCRVELAHGFSSPLAAVTVAMGAPGSLAGLNAGADGSGRGVLEFSCAHAIHVVAYLALLSIPSLALAKPLRPSRNNEYAHQPGTSSQHHERVGSKLGVQSVKSFLHFMSLRLSTTGRATATALSTGTPRFASMKKGTTLPLVSVHFLQEFLRMHREDALEDYLTSCSEQLRRFHNDYKQRELPSEQQIHQQVGSNDIQKKDFSPERDDDLTWVASADLSLDIDWGDGDFGAVEVLSSPSDEESSLASDDEAITVTPEALKRKLQRERDVVATMLNDADEIYTFLAGELQRHSIYGRLDDADTVSQMLDIWVSAGQKYAQVISYLDSISQAAGEKLLLDRKATVLERFGGSLFVFAMQLLKSTSKVFNYEEIFQLTNARVYSHVTAELWDDGRGASFTLDLATETLSLASGKLGHACKLLEELIRLASVGEAHRGVDELPSTEKDEGDDKEDGEEDGDSSRTTLLAVTERYMQSMQHRANCLDVYGDVLAHSKRSLVDFDLGCALEEDHDTSSINPPPHADETADAIRFYSSHVVLSKTSPAGQFYREAKRMYKFLLDEVTRLGWNSAGDRLVHSLTERLASVKFKLASHLPRGCLAEKQLLDRALQHLGTLTRHDSVGNHENAENERISAKRDYISAVRALRTKFFQPETERSSLDELDGDAIAPFYRFVLVAALREVDSTRTGLFTQEFLSHFNELCGRGGVSNSVMAWLMQNFDHHANDSRPGLTEKGIFQYFCWLAEADPLTFCEVLDLLTAKRTETPVSIISGVTSHGREAKGKSLRATFFNHTKPRTSASALSPSGPFLSKPESLKGIADCVVVLSARMTAESCGDLSHTKSPCDVRLDPHVIDVLPVGADVPEELSKFCFPDDPFMSSDPLPPHAFDIVLTDITGTRNYGSCLHFVEERDPIDVLAMISGTQRGTKTASLPPWMSLKEIQQRKAKTRFFIPKCICILSRVPLFQTFRDCLMTMYRLSISLAPYPIESFILNILEQIPVPTVPHSITSFTLVDRIGLLAASPLGVPQLFPNEVDFTVLFQCLSAENILKVYGFLLTERKVVVCSQNVAILTPVTETFRAMLHPFDCQVVYIPVLPLALLDFVTAPVPFFMGVRADPSIDRLPSEGVIVVYLDRDEVAVPSTEILPALPEVRAKKLLHSLRKTIGWAASQQSSRQFGRYQHDDLSEIGEFPSIEVSDTEIVQLLQQQEDLQEKWTELYVLFTTFVMRLLKDFRKFCHRATTPEGRETTTFDKKGYLTMHPSQREFCVHLFQTQHFQRFIDTSDSLTESVLQLAASDAEQSWRHVRSKSIMLRRGDGTNDGDSAKASTRQITRAPPPSRITSASSSGSLSTPGHRRRPSARHIGSEILPLFNSNVYDELRGISCSHAPQSTMEGKLTTALNSRPPLLSHGSSGTLMTFSRTSAASNLSSKLIVAARLRLDAPIESNEE